MGKVLIIFLPILSKSRGFHSNSKAEFPSGRREKNEGESQLMRRSWFSGLGWPLYKSWFVRVASTKTIRFKSRFLRTLFLVEDQVGGRRVHDKKSQ